MTNIGFIGHGIMGGPMASHLNDKGYNLFVFNRSKEKSEKWITQNTKAKVCFSDEIKSNVGNLTPRTCCSLFGVVGRGEVTW